MVYGFNVSNFHIDVCVKAVKNVPSDELTVEACAATISMQ